MKKQIIAIDVDLTVCAIDTLWIEWLTSITGYSPTLPWESIEYNLSSYWKKQLDEIKVDGLEFWRGTSIYDFATPVDGSVEFVNKLKNGGYEIVFVSALKGHHHKSKYNWLKRNFPFDGFIGTKEKQYINCDIFIDDRNKFLNIANTQLKIKLNTPYTQDEKLHSDVVICQDWGEIYLTIETLGQNL